MWSIIKLKMLSLRQGSIGWFLAVTAVWGISLRPLLYLACMARPAVLEGIISMMYSVQQRIATITQQVHATPLFPVHASFLLAYRSRLDVLATTDLYPKATTVNRERMRW